MYKVFLEQRIHKCKKLFEKRGSAENIKVRAIYIHLKNSLIEYKVVYLEQSVQVHMQKWWGPLRSGQEVKRKSDLQGVMLGRLFHVT
jgi:hypothetical protein